MTAMNEGSQLKSNPFLSVSFAISLITWLPLIANFVVHRKPRWWLSNSLIRLEKYVHTSVISLFKFNQFKDMRMYDFSWRNSFSMREIETLRHWVSCLTISDCSSTDESVNIYIHKFKSFGDALFCRVACKNFIVWRNICYKCCQSEIEF